MLISSVAAIVGVILLLIPRLTHTEDGLDATERVLLIMSFTYWLVHCAATSIERLTVLDWEAFHLSLKLTAAITYFLTVACVISLPLHRFAMSQQVEE